MVGMLFILFLSHFISRLLNDLFDSQYIGFLIVTGFYLVSGIVVYLFRVRIADSITNMMFQEEDTEKDEDYE